MQYRPLLNDMHVLYCSVRPTPIRLVGETQAIADRLLLKPRSTVIGNKHTVVLCVPITDSSQSSILRHSVFWGFVLTIRNARYD